MASSKIKKKSGSKQTSVAPRQGAVPCLIVVVFILLVIGLLLYFSLRNAG